MSINAIKMHLAMENRNYRLYDTDGKCFYQWSFKSWTEADAWRRMQGRPDWTIKKI